MNASISTIQQHHTIETTPTPPTARAGFTAHGAAPSRRALWGGRILSGLGALFLAFDAALKVLMVGPAVQGSTELGYATSVVRGLGIVELVCLLTYLFPRTAVLGAVLWTGYLGGAVATHVRVGNPLFSHTLFPIYIATLLWAGLWLREPRLRALLPYRNDSAAK